MSNLKIAILAMAAPVGACVTKGHDTAPTIPRGYNFAYVAAQGAEVGLIQAFDDGSRTYLQFTGPTRDLDIRHGIEEPSLPFRADRSYVLLDGVYDRLNVSLKDNSTAIVNEAAEAASSPGVAARQNDPGASFDGSAIAAPSTRSPIATVGVPEPLQTMQASLRVAELNRELSQLDDRVRLLTAELEEAHQAGQALNLSLRQLPTTSHIVVRFDDNSADAVVDEPLLEPLGAAARAANRIYLHGHTDAFVASDAGTQLAIQRAVAVRQLLLARNVAPNRIRLFYRGAGSFVANNSTNEGKAQNRRVEIELRKW